MASRGDGEAPIERGQFAPGLDGEIQHTAVGEGQARFGAQRGQPPGLPGITRRRHQAKAVVGATHLIEESALSRTHR